MAKRRLNDTAALTEKPYGAGERHTVSCREIENGYLTEISTSNDGTGKYSCRTVFSKEPPKINPPEMRRRSAAEGLGEAVEYLKAEPSGLGK